MELKAKEINTTALAYIGDAVYEIYIRKHVLSMGTVYVDRLHQAAVSYVNAESQAASVKKMITDGFLTEEEMALVKRARNHKIASKPKNVDPMTYKWATAYEALIGYLHLDNRKDRMEEVIERAIEITEKVTEKEDKLK